MTLLPPDFKEFLKLLNSHRVEYLLIGGYAVAYHGYPRPTGDMESSILNSLLNIFFYMRSFYQDELACQVTLSAAPITSFCRKTCNFHCAERKMLSLYRGMPLLLHLSGLRSGNFAL